MLAFIDSCCKFRLLGITLRPLAGLSSCKSCKSSASDVDVASTELDMLLAENKSIQNSGHNEQSSKDTYLQGYTESLRTLRFSEINKLEKASLDNTLRLHDGNVHNLVLSREIWQRIKARKSI